MYNYSQLKIEKKNKEMPSDLILPSWGLKNKDKWPTMVAFPYWTTKTKQNAKQQEKQHRVKDVSWLRLSFVFNSGLWRHV